MIKHLHVSFLLLIVSIPVYANNFYGGATIVPVSDGLPPSSFNLKTDAASIYLEKAIIHKENGWFTKDKEVAFTAKLIINGDL